MVRINTNSGNGTGVIFETTGNGRAFVLTNYHVVDDAYRIEVQISDGSEYSATLKGYDAYKDLAVLEICCSRFRSLRFKDATSVKAGSEVIAIGYPLGYSGSATVTRGIVSAVRYDTKHKAWVIQTDAPINPGNSGGPLLSSAGEVVGINTYTHDWSSEGRPIDGVGFAISEQTIKGVLQEMKLGSRVSFPTPTPTPWPTFTPTPWPTPTSVPVRWGTYSNWTYGYSVQVPIDWTIDDSNESKVYFRSFDGNSDMNIYAYDYRVRSLEDWVSRRIDANRNWNKVAFEVLQKDIENLANGEGIAFVKYRAQSSTEYCSEETTELFLVTYAASYLIRFDICEHSFDKYFVIQDSVLGSFNLR